MEETARAVARIAVARMCQDLGYEAAQASALEALSDMLLRYMSEIGAEAHAAAELAGRAEPNLLDVSAALADLGTSLEDLMRHADGIRELPFPRSLPRLPVRRKPRQAPTFREAGEAPPPHIPAHLPAFPDRHTYAVTPVYDRAAASDPRRVGAIVSSQRRLAEAALVKLQERTAPTTATHYARQERARWGAVDATGAESESLVAAAAADAADAATALGDAAAAGQPFFAAPRRGGGGVDGGGAGGVCGGDAAAPPSPVCPLPSARAAFVGLLGREGDDGADAAGAWREVGPGDGVASLPVGDRPTFSSLDFASHVAATAAAAKTILPRATGIKLVGTRAGVRGVLAGAFDAPAPSEPDA